MIVLNVSLQIFIQIFERQIINEFLIDAAPVDVTKKQPCRRRPRSGGMVAQQSSSRYEYRRFRRPTKIHSGLSTVADKNENACEKNPTASDGISIGSERNKPIESERNDDISGSGDSTGNKFQVS